MQFLCIKHEQSHMSFGKKMCHLLEYLKYWTHTNINHINHNTKFIQFLYELMKIGFHMEFYKLMKSLNWQSKYEHLLTE
jgi:hypothetical protein